MSYSVGDRIVLPEEPPVGTRLRLTDALDPEFMKKYGDLAGAVDVLHLESGWYYAGHLDENRNPHLDKYDDPIKPWDWHYVITTNRDVTIVEM